MTEISIYYYVGMFDNAYHFTNYESAKKHYINSLIDIPGKKRTPDRENELASKAIHKITYKCIE